MMSDYVRLGVNIDHVATIRNARGGAHPDPVKAALLAQNAGADGITAHLREDRRHISDTDIEALMAEIAIPLNFEMAATDEMLDIATRHRPHAACIVPERREERTTEGGLDVVGGYNHLKRFVETLSDAGSRVSLFIAADKAQIETAAKLGAPVIELHTGPYCEAVIEGDGNKIEAELHALEAGAALALDAGLEVHAGHGLTFDSVGPIAKIPALKELNIGHFLIGESIFSGLDSAIKRMRAMIDLARMEATGRETA